MKKLLILMSSFLLLAACSPNTAEETTTETVENEVSEQVTADAEEITVTISLEVEDEDADEEDELQVEEGAILLDVMREHYDVEDDADFITSINGHEQDPDANKYWLFDLNGEMAEVGAHELELEDGDAVSWSLATLE